MHSFTIFSNVRRFRFALTYFELDKKYTQSLSEESRKANNDIIIREADLRDH